MLKRILPVLMVMLMSAQASAQAKLEKLVEEREKMHQEWRESESKKSGIFGNRTKKDMLETHDWMMRIILKDNQIMDELKLLNEIEKTEITYEKNDYKFISQKQEREISILKRALEEKDQVVSEKKSDKRVYEWTTLMFFVSTLSLGYLYWKKIRQI